MEKSNRKAVVKQFVILSISFITLFCIFSSPVHAEWKFGIGTGFSGRNYDGDMGLNSAIPGVGPVKFNVSLSPSDVNDAMKSAFGFTGYATDGTWMILYSLGKLELEGDPSVFVPGRGTIYSNLSWEMWSAEATVGYPIYKDPSVQVLVEGGLRYMKHDLDTTLTLVPLTGPGQTFTNSLSNDWTDAIVGLSINVPFSKEWLWNIRANAGFGGSDGTYMASTALNWFFHPNWSAGINAKYMKIDYENNSPGATDWYKYDVEESSFGLNVMFHW